MFERLTREKTMSFERHHANRNVDRNLARARDLRSEYVNACLSATVELIARARRTWRLSCTWPRRA